MSELPKNFAIYNLERTIANYPVEDALIDMEELDLLDMRDDLELSSLGTREQRRMLMEGLTGKTKEDIWPLLRKTAEDISDRIVPWASLLMKRHVEVGRTIGVYSAVMPQPLVEAYAVGLRTLLPSGAQTRAYGKSTVLQGGVFTGDLEPMLKAETLERLQGAGHRITFVADSFTNALPAVYKADYRLLVNYQVSQNTYPFDHIFCAPNTPYIVHAQNSQRSETSRFDLLKSGDQQGLLSWLIRRDHEASRSLY